MWLELRDEENNDILVNFDHIEKITTARTENRCVLHTASGETIIVSHDLITLNNYIVEEQQRLADLTKTAR